MMFGIGVERLPGRLLGIATQRHGRAHHHRVLGDSAMGRHANVHKTGDLSWCIHIPADLH